MEYGTFVPYRAGGSVGVVERLGVRRMWRLAVRALGGRLGAVGGWNSRLQTGGPS